MNSNKFGRPLKFRFGGSGRYRRIPYCGGSGGYKRIPHCGGSGRSRTSLGGNIGYDRCDNSISEY